MIKFCNDWVDMMKNILKSFDSFPTHSKMGFGLKNAWVICLCLFYECFPFLFIPNFSLKHIEFKIHISWLLIWNKLRIEIYDSFVFFRTFGLLNKTMFVDISMYLQYKNKNPFKENNQRQGNKTIHQSVQTQINNFSQMIIIYINKQKDIDEEESKFKSTI